MCFSYLIPGTKYEKGFILLISNMIRVALVFIFYYFVMKKYGKGLTSFLPYTSIHVFVIAKTLTLQFAHNICLLLWNTKIVSLVLISKLLLHALVLMCSSLHNNSHCKFLFILTITTKYRKGFIVSHFVGFFAMHFYLSLHLYSFVICF